MGFWRHVLKDTHIFSFSNKTKTLTNPKSQMWIHAEEKPHSICLMWTVLFSEKPQQIFALSWNAVVSGGSWERVTQEETHSPHSEALSSIMAMAENGPPPTSAGSTKEDTIGRRESLWTGEERAKESTSVTKGPRIEDRSKWVVRNWAICRYLHSFLTLHLGSHLTGAVPSHPLFSQMLSHEWLGSELLLSWRLNPI